MRRTDVEGEPRPGGTEEDLAILPLGEVRKEIAARGDRSVDLVDRDDLGILDLRNARASAKDEGRSFSNERSCRWRGRRRRPCWPA